MPQINCHIPVKLRITGRLADSQLAELGETLARTLKARIEFAERIIAQRHGGYQRGPCEVVRESHDGARARSGGNEYALPSYDRSGQTRNVPIRHNGPSQRRWQIQKRITVSVQLERFVQCLENLTPEDPAIAEIRALYPDSLDKEFPVVFRLAVANQTLALETLKAEVEEEIKNSVPASREYHYAYTYLEAGRRKMLALDDHHRLRELPDMTRNPGFFDAEGNVYLWRGGMVLFASLSLPRVVESQLITYGEEISISLSVRDLDFIVNPESFERLFHVSWSNYVSEFGARSTSLWIRPIYPNRRAQFRTLKFLVESRIAGTVDAEAAYFGNLHLLNESTVDWLPPVARAQAREISDGTTLRLNEAQREGTWEPDWAGAFIYAICNPTREELYLARHRPEARRLARHLVSLLEGDPDDPDWRRSLLRFLRNTFGSHPADARPEEGSVFELVLAELEAQSAFSTFFEKVESSGDMELQHLLLQLSLATRFAADARVRQLLESVHTRVLRGHRNIYRAAEGEIWLERDPDQAVRRGQVFGTVDSVFIFERDGKRLKPARIPDLREALQRESQDMVGRILRGEDTNRYTEETFAQAALAGAARRMRLSDSDFEDITIQRSMRLVRVESVMQAALPRFYVTFKFVERVEGEEWRDVSDEITEIEDEFEARLIYWALGRAGEFYEAVGLGVSVVAIVAIAWEAGIVAALIQAGGGTGMVVGSIAISEVIYIGRVVFGDAHFSLGGFLMAALEGYLMAVGFRGAGLLGRGASSFIGASSPARALAGWVAEKLVVGVAGGAGSAALITFSHDLVNVLIGRGTWSSFRQYVRQMEFGAVLGVVFEFAAPALQVALRPGTESAAQLLSQIREAGITPARWTALMGETFSKFRAQLESVMTTPITREILAGFEERLVGITEQLGAEYRASVLQRVLELSAGDLTPAAAQGLQKLLFATRINTEAGFNLFKRLAETPAASGALLEIVNTLDAAAVRRLFNETFSGSAAEMSAFLGRLSRYTPAQQRAIVDIVLDLRAEASAGRAAEPSGTLLQRQLGASLKIQAEGVEAEIESLLAQAAQKREQAAMTESWNATRAQRLREQADTLQRQAGELRTRAEALRREAGEALAGGRSAADVVPTSEEFDRLFPQIQAETWIRARVRESVLEAHPESIPRLARTIFRSRSGGRLVFRVEGGASLNARSQELTHIGADGSVNFEPGATLNLNFGVYERAVEFLLQHRPGGRIKVFEVNEEWFQSLRSSAVPERGVPVDPSMPSLADVTGNPRLVDVRFAEDQLQIPPSLVNELQRFVVPRSGRIFEIVP